MTAAIITNTTQKLIKPLHASKPVLNISTHTSGNYDSAVRKQMNATHLG